VADLFEELTWRGLVHQVTDPELSALVDRGGLSPYIGFDPTADSLHIGNLLQLCNLRRMQRAGHRPILLAGGGTGMIGDPSGRSDERHLLTKDQLAHNLAAIRAQLERFVEFDGGRALLVDNGEWLWDVGLLEFLRDIGKHFTVNQMVAKDSVRARFEAEDRSISFAEFSYMLLQAYDFLQLFDRYGCTLQMGASDQWGNITLGVDLIRRQRAARAFGLTSPLVLKPDGTKFGKSVAGNVWLDPARTSPYAFYQFLVRSEDSVVGLYLRYFTDLPRARIEELDRATAERPAAREAQRALAYEVTAVVHGEAEARRAEHAARALFTPAVAELDEATLAAAVADAPTSILPGAGSTLVDVAARAFSESRRRTAALLAQGGISVNGLRETDGQRVLTAADALHGRFVLLRKGKRDQHVLVVERVPDPGAAPPPSP
jgi:tyrosyl-tRNA synthetase